MYFCQPLPTLKQLNLLCSNFPKQFALRLLPELQHLHPEDERGECHGCGSVCAEQRHLQSAPVCLPSPSAQNGDLGASLCLGSARELLTGMLKCGSRAVPDAAASGSSHFLG